jgi:molecular chaperone GrpE
MSKHSFHNEKHHKESAKNKETAGKPEDSADREAESNSAGLGAAQTGPQDTAENAAEAGGKPGAAEKTEGPENGGGAEKRITEMEAQIADYKKRNAELESKIADFEDQLLRRAAEFENFRKRMTREKLEAIEYANQNLLLDLIPILDDFDRAMQSTESSQDFTALYTGVEIIARRLTEVLDNKWGLKSYVSAGTPFDPNYHEALMMEKSSAVVEQIVQMDLLKGYTLKNRVIRSNKVKVLDPDPAAPAVEAPPPPRKEGDPVETAAQESPAEEGVGGDQV